MLLFPLLGYTDEALSKKQVRDLIDEVYLDVLGRHADPGGLKTYTVYLLEDGKDEAWLREVLSSSPEGLLVARKHKINAILITGLGLILFLVLAIAFCKRKSSKDFTFKLIL